MKAKLLFFIIFFPMLMSASASFERLPSIFADKNIADRVDRQRHLEQQWFEFKQENPLVVSCVRQIIFKQNADVWHEFKKSFAKTHSVQDRNKVLDAMITWIVQKSDRSKSCGDLNRFMKKQEDKKMWLVRHCSCCPEYQKKVMRKINKFESFKTRNLDVPLNNKKMESLREKNRRLL